jgi:hypothetical protein
MLKRFSTATLMVLLAFGGALLASSPAGGVAGFGDVPEQSFYTRAVQWMVDNDITTGTSETCFSPNDSVTRGQAAAFMWRMEGEPSAAAHPFNDITKSWQQGPVSWMYANAITTGTSSVTYSPDDTLTRGQLAALLYRLAGNPAGSPTHSFGDVVRPWQQDAVSWMSDLGITTGTTATTFSPDDTVTRGQLAAFFWRYKGKPTVTIDRTHPTFPECPDQIDRQVGSYDGIGVGDCFDFPTDIDPSANRKSCDVPHDAEMFVVDAVPTEFLNPAMPFPSLDEWSGFAVDFCDGPFADYTGLTIDDAIDLEWFDYVYLATVEEDWGNLAWRGISCAVIDYFEVPLVGSVHWSS